MPDKSVMQEPWIDGVHRAIHFIFLLDCSGSMEGEKIQVLNNAIKEIIPVLKATPSKHLQGIEVLVRAVTFSSGAQWHIPRPTPVNDFAWKDVTASGVTGQSNNLTPEDVTDLGKALDLVVEALDISMMGLKAIPPVLTLLSDGQPTDAWETSLEKLNNLPWGKKAARFAVAVGKDADKNMLQEFINNEQMAVCEANQIAAKFKALLSWFGPGPIGKASGDKDLIDAYQPDPDNDLLVW